MKNKFRITYKVSYAFTKYHALNKLRDAYINQNKHEMAKRIAYEAEIQFQKSWDLVHEIYPKLKGKRLTYFNDNTEQYKPGYVVIDQ